MDEQSSRNEFEIMRSKRSHAENVYPGFSRASKSVRKALREYYARKPFLPGKNRVPLAISLFGVEETLEAVEAILSKTATMGRRVETFEKTFARYMGAAHAVMVNSGSSANLLALSAIANPTVANALRPGDEIITPAVTWATTLYPILNVGAKPIVVDIELETLNIDPHLCEQAITERTKALMPVHLLGNPCDMSDLVRIADQNNLFLIEDSCEAHGAECSGRKVGTFGDLGTFSFYFSHHISTVEGGMVVTNDERYAELLRGLRAFGWIRDLHEPETWKQKYPEIDPRFMFVGIGFNLRPSDIQGGFGLHQLPKLEREIAARRENAAFLATRLSRHHDFISLCKERPGTRHVWFGYPITIKPGSPFTRKELTAFLELRGIETRPVMTGNIAEQPVMQRFRDAVRIAGRLDNANLVHTNSFFFGIHSGVGKAHREYIADTFDIFFENLQ